MTLVLSPMSSPLDHIGPRTPASPDDPGRSRPLATTPPTYLAAPCTTIIRPFSWPCTPVLVSYWFSDLVHGYDSFILSKDEPMGTEFQSSTYRSLYISVFRLAEHYACHLLSCWFAEPISSTLKMEAICSSKTSVETQRTTQRHIPEDYTLHNHCCENLKSYIKLLSLWMLKLRLRLRYIKCSITKCVCMLDLGLK
jgi:hypothetical protein